MGDLGSNPGLGRSPGERFLHSSTLAWKIPWMEEPGRLHPMGSQGVRHNWAISLSLSFHSLLGSISARVVIQSVLTSQGCKPSLKVLLQQFVQYISLPSLSEKRICAFKPHMFQPITLHLKVRQTLAVRRQSYRNSLHSLQHSKGEKSTDMLGTGDSDYINMLISCQESQCSFCIALVSFSRMSLRFKSLLIHLWFS